MTYNAKKLEKKLPLIDSYEWSKEQNDLVETRIQPQSFVCDRGRLHVSAENGDGLVDYYGEFRGGYPYINKDLIAWAEKQGMFWDWDSPGSICLCE